MIRSVKKKVKMINHPTKYIEFGDMKADVDELIAPLVLNLWKQGILTHLSCQDNVPKGWIWLCFCSAEDAERFLSIVAGKFDGEVNSLYNRIVQNWETKQLWRYAVSPLDLNTECSLDGNDENILITKPTAPKPYVQFLFSVRFPRKDLKEVEKRVHEALMNSIGTNMGK